ncbi:MAG: DUF4097 family beta strand repeat-containing protein [Blastocatellia bacterium]
MEGSIRNTKVFALSVCLGAAMPFVAFAQHDVPKPPKPKADVVTKPKPETAPTPDKVYSEHSKIKASTSEKSISVDSNVNIKLCVSNGNLRVNGWERNEVRVFVKSGRKPSIRVQEKDAASGKPNWLWITNTAIEGATPAPMSDCLSGASIELDVPMKASLNLSGRTTETTIDSVKKVNVKNISGNIFLRNIAGGITAATYQGGLMVENSAGAISLETTTGNIVAVEVSPGQIGDLFKAKTNSGALSMQEVDHRQIEANSISGSVLFNGKFLPGGIYSFKTSNGSIKMSLPEASSFKIIASYGYGALKCAFPWEIFYETISPGGKNLQAKIGSGDATVNITTSSGNIAITKQ